MARWEAPDLTDKERADLEAIDALDWTSAAGDEEFRRQWAELGRDANWYEEMRVSLGLADAKRPKARAIKAKGAI